MRQPSYFVASGARGGVEGIEEAQSHELRLSALQLFQEILYTSAFRVDQSMSTRQFPLDFVKIDKSFVHGLAVTGREDAVVAAIVTLSHALGLVVIAEGVETQSQLDAVKSLGCDRVQGFLLARPGEPGAVDERIRAGG
jgi:predicted signal transduction protein with EAL and GGDEF domain